MQVTRVQTLPASGELGILYIVEPGALQYTWDGTTFNLATQLQSVIPAINYPQVKKDIELPVQPTPILVRLQNE